MKTVTIPHKETLLFPCYSYGYKKKKKLSGLCSKFTIRDDCLMRCKINGPNLTHVFFNEV